MRLTKNNAKFAILTTAFHGGGVLGYYNNLDNAFKAAEKYRGGCMCGCCSVVPITPAAQKEMNNNCLFAEKLLDEYRVFSPDMHYSTICK